MLKQSLFMGMGILFVGSLASACSSSEAAADSSESNLSSPASNEARETALARAHQDFHARHDGAGGVTVFNDRFGMTAIAFFGLERTHCVGRQVGACEVFRDGDCPPDPSTQKVTAGDIRLIANDPLSRNFTPGTEILKLPARTFSKAEYVGHNDLEKIQVIASGDRDGIPRFSSPMKLPPPNGIFVNEPKIEETPQGPKNVAINRATPLSIKWGPLPENHAGKVVVGLSAYDAAHPAPPPPPPGGSIRFDPGTYITCRFDPTTGSGEIPTEVLAEISEGPGALSITLNTEERVRGFDHLTNIGVASATRFGGVPFGHGFSLINAEIH